MRKKHNVSNVDDVLESLTLFDDDLMSLVFDENIVATELLLKVILQKEDIEVLSVIGQKEFKNPLVDGRNIELDIHIKDSKNKHYNIEIQQSNSGANIKRARFHSSMLDSRMLKEKQDFSELRDSYVIFITEKDYFKKGLPVYYINRHFNDNNEIFPDGSHIIYVNGEYTGNDAIGKLMHDFKCRDTSKFYYSELANGVDNFKSRGGRREMGLIKDYAEAYAETCAIEHIIESFIRFDIDKSLIVNDICKKFEWDADEVEEFYEEILAEMKANQ